MSVRRTSALVLALFAAAAAGCGGPEATAPEPADARPSVIVISIDALRRDHVGLYGYERDVTPGLDRLAKECVVFDEARAVLSWTLVAHMSMMTGLYPRQHGVVSADAKLSPALPLLSERLHDAGYWTIGLTRGGWLSARYGFDRGFDVFREHKNGSELDAHLRQAMADRPTDRPLYLFLHVWDVHCGNITRPDSTIYEPPEEYAALFVGDARERLAGLEAERSYKGDARPAPEQIEALRALYDGGVRYADDLIASWVERWRQSGLLDRAVLVVTSDHGEGLWQRPGPNEEHGGMHEEGLRVPLMIRFPGGEHGGERREELVSHVDLVPTLLEYLDLPIDPWIAGRSLLHPVPEDRLVLAERPPGVTVAYRGSHKLLHQGGQALLYDLESDPLETAGMPAAKATDREARVLAGFREAQRALADAWADAPAGSRPLETRRTEDEIEELRHLGYTE